MIVSCPHALRKQKTLVGAVIHKTSHRLPDLSVREAVFCEGNTHTNHHRRKLSISAHSLWISCAHLHADCALQTNHRVLHVLAVEICVHVPKENRLPSTSRGVLMPAHRRSIPLSPYRTHTSRRHNPPPFPRFLTLFMHMKHFCATKQNETNTHTHAHMRPRRIDHYSTAGYVQ